MTEGEGPARGYSWPPFQRGNSAAVTHGAQAVLKLAPRARELASALQSVMPVHDVADLPAIESLALLLARIERAHEWLDEQGLLRQGGDPQPVLKVLSTWENSARLLMRDLGLPATARASLELDLARTQLTMAELRSFMSTLRAELLPLVSDPEALAAALMRAAYAVGAPPELGPAEGDEEA